MSYIVSFAIGFTSSALLNRPTHVSGFPEVGRYAIGIVVIAAALAMVGTPREQIEKFLLVAMPVGAGVAIARLVTP